MAIHPHARARLARRLLLFILLAALVLLSVWWRDAHNPAAQSAVSGPSNDNVKIQPAVGFSKSQYSLNDPASLWVVVNKGRVLPSDYVPASLVVPDVTLSGSASTENMHLRKDAATALEKLAMDAKNDRLKLMLVSGYRSYTTQVAVYEANVKGSGQVHADTVSARAGHSEHQTGLAADLGATSRVCELETCFGDMAEGKWLAANAYKYGFIIRYQKNKISSTGYDYEPWHLRYVGIDLATQINKTGQTLEQFFGLAAQRDYPASPYQLRAGA